MSYEFIQGFIVEGRNEKLSIKPLPYKKDDLAPSVSENTLNYHYEKLAKTYAERYNKGEGDLVFNEAGVFLHNILFQQYQASDNKNKPEGSIEEFINKHFKSFDNFKKEFEKIAMGIQGSGWVYLSKSGRIKTIVNHEVKKDIVLLIDWWEHAFQFDYKSDKPKYLKNQWYIINWDHINKKLSDL